MTPFATPRHLFIVFLLAHVAVWTLLPALVTPHALLDMVEGLTWGREWQWGYHKHPPLQAWLLEATTLAIGPRVLGMLALSQLAVAAAFIGVWLLARRMVDETRALVAVLLLEGIYYLNYTTPDFNPNVAALPFWAWSGYCLHRALFPDAGAGHQSRGAWIGLGVMVALAAYAKYSAVVLAATIALVLLTPPAWRSLRTAGPSLAAGACLAVLSPQLVWLINSGFLPLQYFEDRAGDAVTGLDHLWLPLQFAADQAFALAPAGLLFAAAFVWPAPSPQPLSREGRGASEAGEALFLTVLTWGPLAITLVLAGIKGLHLKAMWGSQFWCFAGVWAVVVLRPTITAIRLRRLIRGAAALLVGSAVLYAGQETLYPLLRERPARQTFPARAAAEALTRAWQDRVGTPLAHVVGSTWTAGSVSLYSPDRPSVVIDGDFRLSPWADAATLRRTGALIVWWADRETPDTLLRAFPTADLQAPLRLPVAVPARAEAVTVAWAILRPEPPATGTRGGTQR